MSAPQFTPGPWEYRRVESELSLVYCQIGPFARQSRNGSIAYAGTYGKNPRQHTSGVRQSDAECKANAHLIAAAPELYGVCEIAADYLEEKGVGLGLADYIRTALAKARGEQVSA